MTTTKGRAIVLAWGLGVLAAGGAHAATPLESFSSTAYADLSTTLYSLSGGGSTSISFDTALPTGTLSAGAAEVRTTSGTERWGYNYNTDGSVASYYERAYKQVVSSNYFTTNFTVSANTLAVFNTTAVVGGSVQTCYYRDDACTSGNINSGFGKGSANLSVSGTGLYGTGQQSQAAGSTVTYSGWVNYGMAWSGAGTGSVNGLSYVQDPNDASQQLIRGAYSFNSDKLGVTFTNLSNTALTGSLTLNLFSANVTYGETVMVAVPEPESYALFLAGLGGMLVVGRRQRRQNQA
jgi:hypothetical protein